MRAITGRKIEFQDSVAVIESLPPLASPGKSANTRRYVFPPRNLNAVSALCPSGRHYRSISRERARAVSIGIAAASSTPHRRPRPRGQQILATHRRGEAEAQGLGPGRGLGISGAGWRRSVDIAEDVGKRRVSRPMLVVVLKACVMETNETPCASNTSTILAKSASERVRRSTL